ncbi:hypothetical protein F5B18DRAFT_657289 [Nemania serpens]|nr:hypothetical protein F5B18DRAFT_657289 [Nemania serpens]
MILGTLKETRFYRRDYMFLLEAIGLLRGKPLRAAIQLKKVKLTGGLKFNDNGTLYHVIKPGVQQYVGPLSPEIEAVWDTLLEIDGIDLKGDEASSSMGKTFQKPNGGWWLVGVDGFHQDYYDLRHTP